jgi:hypothetical protein
MGESLLLLFALLFYMYLCTWELYTYLCSNEVSYLVALGTA